MDRFVA